MNTPHIEALKATVNALVNIISAHDPEYKIGHEFVGELYSKTMRLSEELRRVKYQNDENFNQVAKLALALETKDVEIISLKELLDHRTGRIKKLRKKIEKWKRRYIALFRGIERNEYKTK